MEHAPCNNSTTPGPGNREAGGIHEIWPLAHEGRIATLIVESDYQFPARIDHNNQLHPASDRRHPDVLETVLQHGGNSIIVSNGTLQHHQHIAAILRYRNPTNEPRKPMKTSHRIAATLLLTTALASCAAATEPDGGENGPPQEDVTTEDREEEDEPGD